MKKTIRLAALLACLCMMISVFCSCSSSKIPAGIYVYVDEDEGFMDKQYDIAIICVFSDGSIGGYYTIDASSDKFKSSLHMKSEEKQANFYDKHKYENGRLVDSRSEYNSYWYVKISDNPNEFDGMSRREVYSKINKIMEEKGEQP